MNTEKISKKIEQVMESIFTSYRFEQMDEVTFAFMEKEISEKTARYIPLSVDYKVIVSEIGGEVYSTVELLKQDVKIITYYNKKNSVKSSKEESSKEELIKAYDNAMEIIQK